MEEIDEKIEQTEQPEVKKMTVKDLFADRKKVLITAIGIIVVLLMLFLFLGSRLAKNRLSSTNPTPTVNLTSPEASVYFDPATINATPGQITNIDVYVDTWGKEISGANIAIKYNPNVISNVKLTQFRDRSSTVSLAFENVSSSETVNGTIELPLNMAPTTPMQKGRGKIAVLSFTTKPANVTQTSLSFAASTALITKTAQKVIVLQKSNLIVHYPINGVFPTEPPIHK